MLHFVYFHIHYFLFKNTMYVDNNAALLSIYYFKSYQLTECVRCYLSCLLTLSVHTNNKHSKESKHSCSNTRWEIVRRKKKDRFSKCSDPAIAGMSLLLCECSGIDSFFFMYTAYTLSDAYTIYFIVIYNRHLRNNSVKLWLFYIKSSYRPS